MPMIERIEGFTRELGKPPDWDNEENGKCHSLAIRDVMAEGLPYMVSAWSFTKAEIDQLLAGETLKVWIQDVYHPVIALTVGSLD